MCWWKVMSPRWDPRRLADLGLNNASILVGWRLPWYLSLQLEDLKVELVCNFDCESLVYRVLIWFVNYCNLPWYDPDSSILSWSVFALFLLSSCFVRKHQLVLCLIDILLGNFYFRLRYNLSETLILKLCERQVNVNVMYCRVSNQINSYEQTRLLFVDHLIYDTIIYNVWTNFDIFSNMPCKSGSSKAHTCDHFNVD